MAEREVVEQMSVRILVVEDNPTHRELISEAIKEASSENSILCVENGDQALQCLQREGMYADKKKYPIPDLIFLDLKLPDMDGKNVLRVIKSNEETRTIPVIVLTASSHDKDIDECYQLGANGYVTKPLASTDFVSIVRTIPFYWTFVNTLPKS